MVTNLETVVILPGYTAKAHTFTYAYIAVNDMDVELVITSP